MRFSTRVLTVLGCLLECGVLALSFLGYTTVLLAALHLLAVIFLGAAGYSYFQTVSEKKMSRPFCLWAFLMTAFFSYFGLMAVFLMAGAFRELRSFHPPPGGESEEEPEPGDLRQTKKNIAANNLMRMIRSEVSFEPFVDIFQGRHTQTKIRAIEKLSRHISRENVGLLKNALRDPSPEIRLYAATALLKIGGELSRKIQVCLEQVKARGLAEDFSELGDFYRFYAQTGIAEAGLTEYYLELAVEAYRNSLDKNTEQPQVTIHYARCLVKLKRYEKAGALMARAVKIWPRDKEMIFLCNEIDFELGKYADLSPMFVRIDPKELGESEKRVFEFWTHLQ